MNYRNLILKYEYLQPVALVYSKMLDLLLTRMVVSKLLRRVGSSQVLSPLCHYSYVRLLICPTWKNLCMYWPHTIPRSFMKSLVFSRIQSINQVFCETKIFSIELILKVKSDKTLERMFAKSVSKNIWSPSWS